MLKTATRKMAEVFYSALVCNLLNLSSTEHPEQQNSGKKKKVSVSVCLMLPPTTTLTRGRHV